LAVRHAAAGAAKGQFILSAPVADCSRRGKWGMFDQRTQKTNVVYAMSDQPMSAEEWSKRHVTPH
jgi:hypothetical protein